MTKWIEQVQCYLYVLAKTNTVTTLGQVRSFCNEFNLLCEL